MRYSVWMRSPWLLYGVCSGIDADSAFRFNSLRKLTSETCHDAITPSMLRSGKFGLLRCESNALAHIFNV